jgi:hypothetical protein
MSIRVTLIPPEGEKMERIFDSYSVLVGRSSKCDLTLDTESLSRKHCLIEFDDGEFYITDLSSTNGVYIEGHRIKPEVRIPLNIFLPLQISIFDCVIQEVEITAIRNPPILKTDHLLLLTTPTKKINTKALNQPLKMLPKDKKADFNNLVKFGGSALIFFGIILFSLFGLETEGPSDGSTVEVITSTAPKKIQKPQPIKSEDIFLSPYVYMQLHETRNCDNKIYCENLFLIMEEGEGIKKENNDQIVFLKPSKHLSTARYSKLSPEDVDLIAFDLILNSRIMEDYLTERIGQIHLAIVAPDYKIARVYRFHASRFNLKNIHRQVLNPLLNNSLENNKPKEFWDVILTPVQKFDLPQ